MNSRKKNLKTLSENIAC